MTAKIQVDIAQYISECLQLAVLLEVSSYPKPGNVHRTVDFKKTRYEHFLASAVAVAPHFKLAAERGMILSTRKTSLDKIKIGEIIKNAVEKVDEWQHGENTLLGTIILLMPIAVAAGMTLAEDSFSINKLRDKMRIVVESTTPADAVAVYDAIEIAKPGGLGEAPKLDVTDSASKQKILQDEVTLFDVFKIASKYDSITYEWINNYPITFDLAYPYFIKQLEKAKDVNTATVHTFLKILAEIPDTLIARKAGLSKAKEVSAQAKQVLEMGGLATQTGKDRLWKFDEKLRGSMHQLNPGTTADIIAAVLAVSILDGYRP